MQKYRIADTDTAAREARSVYRSTMSAAHTEAKKVHPDVRHDVRIELVDVATNAQAIEDYLNGVQPIHLRPLKSWRLSPRGGLIELNDGGTDAKAPL